MTTRRPELAPRSAKDIVLKPIAGRDAHRVIDALHYSGSHTRNASIHFGVFLDGECGGAMSFGPSLDQSKMFGLVKGTQWGEWLELNRLAFADWLPRNSESRALGVAMRMLRKLAPHLKWIISFADACRCGDGTIYRAAGFLLTDIRPNRALWVMPDGRVTHKISAFCDGTTGAATKGRSSRPPDAKVLEGFQLRYLYFLKPEERANLLAPVIPYSEIDVQGARMYRGVRGGSTSGSSDVQSETGGASPTSPLSDEGKETEEVGAEEDRSPDQARP